MVDLIITAWGPSAKIIGTSNNFQVQDTLPTPEPVGAVPLGDIYHWNADPIFDLDELLTTAESAQNSPQN